MAAKTVRKEAILDFLKNKNIITVKELAQHFSVSDMTIRRDLYTLEENDSVEIFFGGVSLKNKEPINNGGYSIENELEERTEQKERIAKKAVSLIKENDVILIDTGSTTGSMLNYIEDDMFHTVYCYALNIINGVCARPNLRVVACGGYFHNNTRMFESEEGASLIKKTYINKAFLAARGITKEVGITTAEPYEIEMKKAAISSSEQKILLVDSTKFGKAWYAKYADLSEIDVVITDTDVDKKYIELLKKMDIVLYIV